MGGAEQNIYDNQKPSVSTVSWKTQNGTSLEKKNLQESHIPMVVSFVAPDGGSRAWLVLFCAFLCNGVIWGIINSYSVLQHEFYQNLAAKNDTQASSKAGKCFSLFSFTIVSIFLGIELWNLCKIKMRSFNCIFCTFVIFFYFLWLNNDHENIWKVLCLRDMFNSVLLFFHCNITLVHLWAVNNGTDSFFVWKHEKLV